MLAQRLIGGGSYGERALFETRMSSNLLVAESICEVWWLSKRSFEDILSAHFTIHNLELALKTYKTAGHWKQLITRSTSGITSKNGASARGQGLRKLMEKVRSDAKQSLKSTSAWRFPNSRFRVAWRRVECLLLVYLAIEVPFQITFDRWMSIFASSAISAQSSWANATDRVLASYSLSLLVELFFYVDWYLCVFCFVRSTSEAGQLELQSSYSTNEQARDHAHDLIVQRSHLLRYYKEYEPVWLDFLANVPLAIVWDSIPKPIGDNSEYVGRYLRFMRILRLLRLRALPKHMQAIMLELNFSPSSQLMMNVTIGLLLLALAMSCLFFLLADLSGFIDGLPSMLQVEQGLASRSVTRDSCLIHASLFGNCTWYMYDFSSYAIDAPFVRSLHWSIDLLSTVGYGDIMSFSTAECFVGFWWIYWGAVLCYFTACAISSVLSQWNVQGSIKSDRLEQINKTLASMNLHSPAIISTIQRYYTTKWKLNGSAISETNALVHLPQSLKQRVTHELYTDDLVKCGIFSRNPQKKTAIIFEIAEIVRCETFLKGMQITGAGHLAQEMFIIQYGAVELLMDYQMALNAVGSRRNSNPDILRMISESLLAGARRRSSAGAKGASNHVALRTLHKNECLGIESLSPCTKRTYTHTSCSVTTSQLLVIARVDLLRLVDRSPNRYQFIFDAIETRLRDDKQHLGMIQRNISRHGKIPKVLGAIQLDLSEYTSANAARYHHHRFILDPESSMAKYWEVAIGSILLYNFYQITFRIAFLWHPSQVTSNILQIIDYGCDVMLYADMFIQWNHLGFVEYSSGKVMDRTLIRQRYVNSSLRTDLLSMLPIYGYSWAFWHRSVARFPRLLKSNRLLTVLRELEERIQARYLNGSKRLLALFDLIKFLLFFLSAAHQVGCGFFLLGRLELEYGVSDASWTSTDPVINAYPGNVLVQYIRAVYWCLETVRCSRDSMSWSPMT